MYSFPASRVRYQLSSHFLIEWLTINSGDVIGDAIMIRKVQWLVWGQVLTGKARTTKGVDVEVSIEAGLVSSAFDKGLQTVSARAGGQQAIEDVTCELPPRTRSSLADQSRPLFHLL